MPSAIQRKRQCPNTINGNALRIVPRIAIRTIRYSSFFNAPTMPTMPSAKENPHAIHMRIEHAIDTVESGEIIIRKKGIRQAYKAARR